MIMSSTDGLNLVKNVSIAIRHYSSLSVEQVFLSFSPICKSCSSPCMVGVVSSSWSDDHQPAMCTSACAWWVWCL